MQTRKMVAEGLGTFFLVFFAVGVATLSFGFKVTGTSASAGVVATALTFGLVLLILAYAIGPISGCHINPAVTMGFLVSGRMKLEEALGYWVSQVVGAILGALALWGVLKSVPGYSTSAQGLGTDGWGENSMVGLHAGGAFAAEAVLTLLFVFVILCVTSRIAAGTTAISGLVIGLSLTVVHLIGIPLTGTSVNPARSLGPALIVGHDGLSQLWLFIVAPLVGAAVAAGLFKYFEAGVPQEATAKT